MQIHIYSSPEEVIQRIAAYVISVVNEAINQRGVCNLALSGGSSPKKLYELLALPEYRDRVDWQRAYFFFGDERFVPADHPDNNGLMVRKAFFDPLKINEANIFYVDTSGDPATAASQYEQRITSHFAGELPVFDLVLLGLGDNAHTASLFPHTPVLQENKRLVSEVYLKEQDSHRITFTSPLINGARAVAFLVYGAGKAQAVSLVLEGENNIEEFPAQLIRPKSGLLHWFLDQEAASQLKNVGDV